MGLFDDMASAAKAESAKRVDAARNAKDEAERARAEQLRLDRELIERVAVPVFEEARSAFDRQSIGCSVVSTWKEPSHSGNRQGTEVQLVIGKIGVQYVRASATNGKLHVGLDDARNSTEVSEEEFPARAAAAIEEALQRFLRILERRW